MDADSSRCFVEGSAPGLGLCDRRRLGLGEREEFEWHFLDGRTGFAPARVIRDAGVMDAHSVRCSSEGSAP